MALTRMLQRRGTFAQWDAVKEDLVLQPGEIGLETNTGKFKIGNGVDDWATLSYIENDGYNLAKYARIGTALAPVDQTLYGTRTVEGVNAGLTTFVIDVPAGVTADYIQEWQKNGVFVAGITPTGGAKFSDDIDMSGNTVTGLPLPSADTEAASKLYVDEMVAGLAWKEAAHLFSNSNVSLTGSTGTLIVDGHAALVAADDGVYRIILNAQTTATQNGIYLYTDNGTNYTLVRTDDAQTPDQLHGASIYVQEGATYGTSSWVQSNYSATTFDQLTWVQFSGAALITDGAGLLKEGNTLSVIGTAGRISVTPDNVDIDAGYVGQKSINTVGTITASDTSDVPLKVEGIANHNADLQQWIIDDAGDPWVVGQIRKNGLVSFYGPALNDFDSHYLGLTNSTYDDSNELTMTSKRTVLSNSGVYGSLTEVDLQLDKIKIQSSSSGNEESFVNLDQTKTSIIQQDYTYRHRIDLDTNGIKFGTGQLSGQNTVKEVLSLTQSQIDANSKININLDSNVVGLTVKGHTSQTANLQEWKNNAGSTLSSVSPAGIITANNYNIGLTVEAGNSIALSFSGGTGLHTRSANGDIVITASGYTVGATKTLFITCDGTSRNLTFPSSWIWVGSKPTSILASRTGVLTVTSLGTAEANAVASWVVQL